MEHKDFSEMSNKMDVNKAVALDAPNAGELLYLRAMDLMVAETLVDEDANRPTDEESESHHHELAFAY